jgi:hypothetical protein
VIAPQNLSEYSDLNTIYDFVPDRERECPTKVSNVPACPLDLRLYRLVSPVAGNRIARLAYGFCHLLNAARSWAIFADLRQHPGQTTVYGGGPVTGGSGPET